MAKVYKKVLLNSSPNALHYYPKSVSEAMQNLNFPQCRVAGAEAMEQEGLSNQVSLYGFDATEVMSKKGNALSVIGRHNVYYAFDAQAQAVIVYEVKKVDISRPWTIVKTARMEILRYATVHDEIKVLDAELNYCEFSPKRR